MLLLTSMIKFERGDAHVIKLMFTKEKKAKLKLNSW